jgi:hypothetical protein
VARRTTWLIDMGDGTWAVSCMACRIALYRGPKAGAERAARNHSAAGAGRPERGPTRGPGAAARSRTHPVDGRAAHRQPTSVKEHS